jgi:hypothetical protein
MTDDLELLKRGDPSSSSYELNAIGGEDASDLEVQEGVDRWDDEEDGYSSNVRQLRPGRALPQPVDKLTDPIDAALPPASPAEAAAGFRPHEPWHARLLEGWGVLLLIWAGLIVMQSLYRLRLGEVSGSSGSEVIVAVVSVLLLTAGAGALFLLVDMGRQIRESRSRTALRGEFLQNRSGLLVNLRGRRFWQASLRAAQAPRS